MGEKTTHRKKKELSMGHMLKTSFEVVCTYIVLYTYIILVRQLDMLKIPFTQAIQISM